MHEGLIVHCSDSPQGRGDTVRDIDRWHKERGWSGVGYHYVILEDGTVQEGRDLWKAGAHAKGYNGYVGVCLIGKDSFTDEQMVSLEHLIRGMKFQFGFENDKILGHYDVSSKTCPNMDVQQFVIDHNI